MKASELRELNNTELEEKLKSLKEELFNLRFQLAINQLENCLLYTSPSPRDISGSRMPSSA